MSLSLAVALGGLRVLLQIGFLIFGMLSPPLLLAVADHLRVQRVRPDLLAMVFGAAASLARQLTANALLESINRRLESLLAVWTSAGWDQGFPQRFEEVHL